MAKYKRCPRCELNWIPEEEDFCDVCKAELKIGGASLLEDEEEELCPVCHQNFLEPGEKICAYCAQKNADKDDEDGVYNIDDTDRSEEDIENVSFDELAEEESWEDYDEPFDDSEGFDDADYDGEDEDEEENDETFEDDLEDDFDYDIDSVDDIDDEDEEPDDNDDND